tara:strand:- start:10 stop:273 length:264 start_codon:yes stop_codon:yes gene_type:complete
MNKILVAMILAIVMSGNAYSEKNFYGLGLIDNPTYEECKKTLVKGNVLEKGTSASGGHTFSILYKDYLYWIVIADEFYCYKFDNTDN